MVAAVIRKGDTFLLARRPLRKRHGGLWEFPGGKVAEGEGETAALARELQEELGVRLLRSREVEAAIRDPGSPFEIRFRSAEIEGTPRALEHVELRWVTRTEALALELAPSDRRFLESLNAPNHPAKDCETLDPEAEP